MNGPRAMSMQKTFAFACALALAGAIAPLAALAQTPGPAAPVTPAPGGPKLVLLPYESPGSTDPHAKAITENLAADLTAAGLAVTTVAPVDHIDAVANAAKICADNGATGILIAEGRYEQTYKMIPAPFVNIVRYPTHVELRLDEVGCDGAVRWTAASTADENPSGAFSVANLGSYVDTAFRNAAKLVATTRAGANVPQPPPPAAAVPVAAPAAAAPPSTYLLVPFGQPGIADPRADDITHSLLTQMQQRKLDVKAGTPIDQLSVVTAAAQLCAANGVQAILVPNVRLEQSGFTARTHAALRLTLVSCTGTVLGHGAGEADMGQLTTRNMGASLVGISERAMIPALDQLFPGTTPNK